MRPTTSDCRTAGRPQPYPHWHLRQAANAYRIEAKGDVELEGMVGKQVSVSGTLRESADLLQMSGSSRSDAETSWRRIRAQS